MDIKNLLVEAKKLSTPELSDALDYYSLPGVIYGLKSITVNQSFAGTAWTVRYIPVDHRNPGSVGDYIDEVGSQDVVVIDNAGRSDCTVWGGILSQVAAKKGIAGTVIYGVSRDTNEAVEANYPIFALNNFMRTGKDRVQVKEVRGDVNIGGTLVNHGDIIVADIDGVVVLELSIAGKVINRAREMKEIEDEIVKDALNGMSIKDARKKHNYHLLQRNPSK